MKEVFRNMSEPYFNNIKSEILRTDLKNNLEITRSALGETADLNIINITIGSTDCAILSIEGMASSQLLAELVFEPLTNLASEGPSANEIIDMLEKHSLMSTDRQLVTDFGKLFELLFSGFAAILIDGVPRAVCLGIQGFEKRAVSIPEAEQTISGARDSFTETLRTNMSLIRRRLKTPALRFELLKVGKLSVTDICIAHIEGRASTETINKIKQKLQSIELDTVLNAGYLMPFLDETYNRSIFSALTVTERPDNACAALNEGKILVIIDGTPGCILLPTVFADNFRTMDDYCEKPFYAAFSRWIKYASFLLAVLLPGLYTALVMFHPEVFPLKLLLNLAAAEVATPYPPVVEMLLLMVLFEIMREAGVRLPRSVGGAVSIVGGLIIGDAAVKSGMVSQPLLIVVGMTATASFVLPSLYPAITVLRLIFIIAGGFGGLYGIAIASALLIFNISAVDQYGTAFTSPLLPLRHHGLTDIFARAGFRQLAKRHTTVTDNSSDVQ
ncbi:spore germination protein KA [Ruminococcus albus]|uniref:Spore germination protein KA n=2 Tax=Ruminococcus albus TaxID=1264 RepID=A0A1H7PHA3_RUMAL|nr:spore germination protein KA [Ruminococcus albus]